MSIITNLFRFGTNMLAAAKPTDDELIKSLEPMIKDPYCNEIKKGVEKIHCLSEKGAQIHHI